MIDDRAGLNATLDAALTDPDGSGIALFGAAGVGKTVLARAGVRRWSSAQGAEALVRWVSATASTREIPFGAFAHLIDVPPGSNPAAVLRTAKAELCPPAGHPVLLVIDDAHLLDGYSATLVHQMVTTSRARVLITCRSGEPTPEAITAVWKDGHLPRLDVGSLTAREVTRVMESVLGGPVSVGAAERVFTLSQGNPLFLRHLVEGARQHDGVHLQRGEWQWTGPTTLNDPLLDLIDTALRDLPAGTLEALRYLAIEEPLPVAVLASLVDEEALEDGERVAALRITSHAGQLHAFSGHPLYTERLRAAMGHLHARRLRTELVHALTQRDVPVPAVSPVDRLRLTALALDSDAPPPLADLTGAAWQAMFLGDFELTERLASAALARSGDLAARMTLAQAVCWQGRGSDAEEILDAVDPADLSGFELVYWAICKAANEFWMLRRAEQAASWLTQLRARITEPTQLATIDGLASQFAMNLGRLDDCLRLADAVLTTPGVQDLAVAWAASAAALSCARLGRLQDVPQHVSRTASVEQPDGVRYGAALGEAHTAILQGRVDVAANVATHHLQISERRQPAHASGQVLVGHVQVIAGDLPAAIAHLRGATEYYQQTGNAWGALNSSWLATALGQLGDAAGAAAALADADRLHDARTTIHLPELRQARVWTLAAERNLVGARAAARTAITTATATGQLGPALLAHHDALRLGDVTALAELIRLTRRIDCAYGTLVLAHAQALAANDGKRLERVATQLEDAGLRCAAADAAAQAATAHGSAGHTGEALRARATAARLRQGCGQPMTPALQAALQPLPLTGREHQIAVLVAAGHTNKSIAEQLTLSVRTVETHVLRACTKLGAANRAQLTYAVNAAHDL
ncbi:transcriptional regulator [Mycolicibacterium madagascariense]|uniref:Transcriptional regulator n=1 Tax=Mycolicibacterium madagascariense TaxID=212765 RepID=A0A7I7XDR5_9MYCO|nr:transcriptional regulator [Mycolicibacterium madagascariense]